ncbi:MAG: hypothetical protein V4625_10850 [Pseudomonadota bacterium]
MFSDHLPKIDRISGRSLFLMAGGLVIACQLVAMTLVAGEQVKKAEIRDSQMLAQRAAIAKCFDGNTRAERQDCMVQARNLSLGTTQVVTSNSRQDSLPRESASYTDFTRGSSSGMQASVMGVSFAAN